MSGDAERPDSDRREQGKANADRLRAQYDARGAPLAWFEACYAQAQGDPALVPWGHEEVRPEFAEWLAALPPERRKGRALDVGAGLGDNAAALARAGFDVTAFDISRTAMGWAASRFPDLHIEWREASIVQPPRDWSGAFGLVTEIYTLQALHEPERGRAIANLGRLVAPGGTLLIVALGRHDGEAFDPPPWPILRAELDPIAAQGLEPVAFDDTVGERRGKTRRHFRAEYRRPAG